MTISYNTNYLMINSKGTIVDKTPPPVEKKSIGQTLLDALFPMAEEAEVPMAEEDDHAFEDLFEVYTEFGSSKKEKYECQLGLYTYLFETCTMEKVEEIIIVQVEAGCPAVQTYHKKMPDYFLEKKVKAILQKRGEEINKELFDTCDELIHNYLEKKKNENINKV